MVKEDILELRGISRETTADLKIILHVNRPLTNTEMLTLQETLEMALGEFGLD